ncbi:VOC family protein [Methanosarcina mazei]|nr:VOC family protein [Methanosarcina mazei]
MAFGIGSSIQKLPDSTLINNDKQYSYGDNMKVKYATIIVEDMDESIKFYTEVMGLEIDSQHNPLSGVAITLLKGEGDAMIELIKNTENETGLFSVGMDVEDINTTVKELKSKGAKITMEPIPITVGTLAFLEDPNGVKIALIQHH